VVNSFVFIPVEEDREPSRLRVLAKLGVHSLAEALARGK